MPGADKDTAAVDGGHKGARKGQGALFRVDGDGRLEQLHALTQTYFTSLAIDPAGAIYAAAANKGRNIPDRPRRHRRHRLERRRARGRPGVLGRHAAGVHHQRRHRQGLYRVKGKATDARYVSEVYDGKSPARWGRLVWQGTGKVTVETRTGNTAKPNVGWSPWAAPTKVAQSGGDATGGPIASPRGRYLQFRVALPDGGAVRRVVAYYLPQNTATAINKVTMDSAPEDPADAQGLRGQGPAARSTR